MSRNLSISETGLRLIKAFEGYRPVDRELVTGARVVGYGHRIATPEPRAVSRDEAEELLRLDLQAYEELINEEVHAPLTQSQFDALCSLAFNIGPKAFRASDTLRALNNGRVLDAANGFDIWRKATIDGKTYVVDALMRRRTVEKSLFLRTERSLAAPGALLAPERDTVAALVPTDDGLPVFTESMSAGVIAKAPYEAQANPMRRRDDSPSGVLTLSEVLDPVDVDRDADQADAPAAISADDAVLELSEAVEPANDAPKLSVIQEAADALGDRLGALIDSADEPVDRGDWPQSLIQPRGEDDAGVDDTSNLVAFPAKVSEPVLTEEPRATIADTSVTLAEPETPPTLVIDEIAADDVMRSSRDAEGPVFVAPEAPEVRPISGLWIPVVLGFGLLGASIAALLTGARDLLGDWGPFLALGGAIVGALMIVFALYMATAGALSGDD